MLTFLEVFNSIHVYHFYYTFLLALQSSTNYESLKHDCFHIFSQQ